MKKQAIILLLSILVTTLFFSCTQKTIKTDEKDFAKRYFLSKDTTKGALSVDIEAEIPVAFTDKEVLKSIRSTIIANLFGDEYISHSNDSLVLLFTKDLVADYKENNSPLLSEVDSTNRYSFNNEHVVSGFSLLSDKKIYVYGIERYVYMGGAHGLETRNYYNFDLKTGKTISEKDLFKPNYETELSELIKKRIVEESKEMKETKDTEPILSLEDTDFWEDSIKPNGNFYITDEGINYVFNPYEIAPYYMGQTEVTLPFNRLKNVLKPNSIIAYLVEKQQ
ncbi:MAG: RsiV family protein [Bacteroidota bacterium]|nr:RsiV family protein [Bacteroidota bacterium]